jgi:hypothetical protein
MSRRREYSTAIKIDAVQRYRNGESSVSVAESIGAAPSTITDWDMKMPGDIRLTTFKPEILTERLSDSGELVTIEAEDNDSFDCSICGGAMMKEGWFTDSIPDFNYCPWCGTRVKQHSEPVKQVSDE